MALDDILTVAFPFGPTDQTQIEELKDALAILEISGPSEAAVQGHNTLIYGRKGCGKSSVISVFQAYSPNFNQSVIDKIGLQKNKNDRIIVKIDTWTRFLDINTHVHRQLLDMYGAPKQQLQLVDYELIPPEVVERVWIDQIWEQIFMKFRDIAIDRPSLGDRIPNVLLCFDDEKMARMRGTPDYIASKIFSDAKKDVINLLDNSLYSISVLFDSMDIYPIKNETFSLSMSGFLRAINKMNVRHKKLRIVFSLPEELLPYFRLASSNLLKDFAYKFAMRWSPRDLMRVAAHRYSLFLKLHDEEYYKNHIRNLDLSTARDLQTFYHLLLPPFVKNNLNIEEPTIAYIMRHTHLLPRHLLISLNKISSLSFSESKQWRQFSSESILQGIRSAQDEIALEILKPYAAIYKDVIDATRSSLVDLPPIFKYGDFDKAISRMNTLWQLRSADTMVLLFDMGIVGRLEAGIHKDSIYTMAEFYYNYSGNVSFSGSDDLCFHPVFSRHFNAHRRRNGDNRLIYPVNVLSKI